MLRSWTACFSALFVASALIGCSSDSSDAPGQPAPAQDAATEAAEEASSGEDAQPESATGEDAQPEGSTAEDAAPDGAGEADAKIKACPIEKDLSTVALPCDCYGTIVEDVETAMPNCDLKVLCCPAEKGLKCE